MDENEHHVDALERQRWNLERAQGDADFQVLLLLDCRQLPITAPAGNE